MNTGSTPSAPAANMRWLWTYVMRHRLAAVVSVASGMVAGLTTALEPYMIGVIVDHIRWGFSPSNQPYPLNLGYDFIYAHATPQMIVRDVVVLIVLAIVTVIAFHGQRRASGTVAYSVAYDVRKDLFNNLLTLDQAFFQHNATGDLISRMHSDVDTIWRLLAITFTRIGSAMFGLVATFVLLALIDLPLTLVVFVVLAVSTTLQIRAGLVLAPYFEQVQNQAGTVAALVQDSFSGIQTIKTFGREAGVSRRFNEENREYRRRWLFFKRRNEPVGMLPNMISQLASGIVVLFGGILTLNGSLTIGNFTQFLLYLGMISSTLLHLGMMYQRYQQTRGALTRITPLLQTAAIRSAPDAEPLPEARGDIRFEGVSVAIDGTPLLRDITVHIPAGQVVALVGATGSGKTLLVSLLARVLDPNEGRVLIDGHDIRLLRVEDLRRAIAYVPQSTFLFSQTLGDNIRMGKPDISDDKLNEAVHISRLSNDLPQLPHGTETLVGEKGVMLSGGQKQRVAIARALVRDPAILVLDDALSSVDTQTAADILSDLRHVLRSRTSLIIAHRIATVKDADRILVLSEGRIVEQGTHASLIAQNGLYARMVERELKEEEQDDDKVREA